MGRIVDALREVASVGVYISVVSPGQGLLTPLNPPLSTPHAYRTRIDAHATSSFLVNTFSWLTITCAVVTVRVVKPLQAPRII